MAEAAPPSNENKPKSAPQRALEKLGLTRDIDLALHLPLRYEDETQLTPIAALRDGDIAQVEGVVTDSRVQFRPRRQLVVKLHDAWNDDPSDLVLRFLHFYPSHQKTLAEGARVRVRGEARGGFFGLEMVHPSFKAVSEGAPLARALTPVYPSTAQLPQAYLRKAVASGLAHADLGELLPPGSVPRQLPTLRDALAFLHHPAPDVSLATLEDHSHPAWQRLKFEELLAQQLSQLKAKLERERQRSPAFALRAGGLQEKLLAALPFALTEAQRRVVEEIARDLGRETPMHRLLQGDVGSGKTVVAALAAAVAIDSGWQCALMAPTELLAEQHFRKLVQWLDPLLAARGQTIAWLTGSRKGKARTAMVAQVADGTAALVVGTHAVIQDDVAFARLGLAIIDEQHRFGVAQRLALRNKLAGEGAPGPAMPARPEAAVAMEPHLLMMSATPIPRTLAMSYYADLDVSTIDELPPGRTPVLTKVFADTRRDEVVARIRDELAQGRQV
ncbi:MAG: ATP-dependent DNA helicase RecG, partial [Burkholderiaceae bacterium]